MNASWSIIPEDLDRDLIKKFGPALLALVTSQAEIASRRAQTATAQDAFAWFVKLVGDAYEDAFPPALDTLSNRIDEHPATHAERVACRPADPWSPL